jgi:hypothetical protein
MTDRYKLITIRRRDGEIEHLYEGTFRGREFGEDFLIGAEMRSFHERIFQADSSLRKLVTNFKSRSVN